MHVSPANLPTLLSCLDDLALLMHWHPNLGIPLEQSDLPDPEPERWKHQ